MVKKTYVVAEGNAFTAAGHIYAAGEEIPESVFSDKTYFAKMVSEGKIVQKNAEAVEETTAETSEAPAEEPVETLAEEVPAEEPVETSAEETLADGPATKRSTAKGGK